MRISFRIALPVAALGILGVAAAGWLTWSAIAGLNGAGAAGLDQARSAALQGGAAAGGAILLAALCLVGAALRAGRRLECDMAGLPRDLRLLVEHGWTGKDRAGKDRAGKDRAGKLWAGIRRTGTLAGEERSDEFGAMVRELRDFAGTMRDMAQSRAEMERMALTDPLTGLPNRRGLYDFFATRGRRRGVSDRGPIAVMSIDLDHFKTVNDANGHEAGDVVLREAARRMALAIRDSDILARVGGDEFVIVAQGVTGLASLERLVERVMRQFDEPVVSGDRSFRVTSSIGAVLGGRRGRIHDAKRLLINADLALAHAKARGRNRWSVFTAAMARDLHAQQERGLAIRRAVERGEFRVWYRPIMDVPSGRPVALDLVTRWHDPERGVLSAGAFIDSAEAHALTEALAVPAFESAFRQIGQWREQGLALPPLHVSVGRTVILSPGIVDRIRWILDSNHIDPTVVSIAFSERYCTGRGVEAVIANLRRIADLGAGIVIDDFGSVGAAIGNITRLGAGQIKVNVARTAGLVGCEEPDPVTGARMQALLPGIIRIGESLGVRVLAKRVDAAPQRDFLLARGFAAMQGDAVAPVMDAAATGEWLAGHGPGCLRAAG